MKHPKRRGLRRWPVALIAVATVAALTALGVPSEAATRHHATMARPHNNFVQTNLVSDVPGLAALTDPAVVNPWGIAFGPTTPLWVSNQATTDPSGVSKVTIYAGANGTSPVSKIPLEVNAVSPTGMVFNPTDKFVIDRDGASGQSRFIFNENPVDGGVPVGQITGWSPDVPPPDTGVTKVSEPGSVYLGMALERVQQGTRILVANVANGEIEVYNGKWEELDLDDAFVDPRAARHALTPYNVAVLDQRVYVAYVSESDEDFSGAISVFTRQGDFVKRLVTNNRLDDPWGMVIAPPHWGRFGGDLLVGNEDGGRINAFKASNGHFDGVLRDETGMPIENDGLWGLQFGNGVIGTPRDLVFAAGIDEYEHGLIGLITPHM
jgi:uncharacterized protein (TIGR03118 family)